MLNRGGAAALSFPKIISARTDDAPRQNGRGDNGPASLDRSRQRRIFVQRQMRTRLIVIGKIRGQDRTQMLLAEDENVIQTVAPKRSNEAFDVWILPRRSR
jgi:hypothetical protein